MVGMALFHNLGAPLGLLLANGVFLLITALLGQAAMTDWAWRIPFLSSFVLVAIGLYVRLKTYGSTNIYCYT